MDEDVFPLSQGREGSQNMTQIEQVQAILKEREIYSLSVQIIGQTGPEHMQHATFKMQHSSREELHFEKIAFFKLNQPCHKQR